MGEFKDYVAEMRYYAIGRRPFVGGIRQRACAHCARHDFEDDADFLTDDVDGDFVPDTLHTRGQWRSPVRVVLPVNDV